MRKGITESSLLELIAEQARYIKGADDLVDRANRLERGLANVERFAVQLAKSYDEAISLVNLLPTGRQAE